jgi:hypothetical protein
LQWPTKNELKKFREIKSGKQEDIGHNAKISFYDAALHKDEDGEIELLDPEIELYSEDEKTKNLNHIISDYARITRGIANAVMRHLLQIHIIWRQIY